MSADPAATEALLARQIAYYRARAPEYDEWWERRGRYDWGAAVRGQWRAEAAEVEQALTEFAPRGRILELASGTGIWTEKLLPFGTAITAVDASPETIALNRARLGSPKVRYVEADIFQWQPSAPFDTVFFGFWLSHIPPARFPAFWEFVRGCLAPRGRVFFVDSLPDPSSTARDSVLPRQPATTMRRRLNDGREFEIVKVYYAPAKLAARLRRRGWQVAVRRTRRFFFHGTAERRS